MDKPDRSPGRTKLTSKSSVVSLDKKPTDTAVFNKLKARYFDNIRASAKPLRDSLKQMHTSSSGVLPFGRHKSPLTALKSGRQLQHDRISLRPEDDVQLETETRRKPRRVKRPRNPSQLHLSHKKELQRVSRWFEVVIEQHVKGQKNPSEKERALRFILEEAFDSLCKLSSKEKEPQRELLPQLWGFTRELLDAKTALIHQGKKELAEGCEQVRTYKKELQALGYKVKELEGALRKKDELMFKQDLEIKYLRDHNELVKGRYDKMQSLFKEFTRTGQDEHNMYDCTQDIHSCLNMIAQAATYMRTTRLRITGQNTNKPQPDSFWSAFKSHVDLIGGLLQNCDQQAQLLGSGLFLDTAAKLKQLLQHLCGPDSLSLREDRKRRKALVKFARAFTKEAFDFSATQYSGLACKMIDAVYATWRKSANKNTHLSELLFAVFVSEFGTNSQTKYEQALHNLGYLQKCKRVACFLRFVGKTHSIQDLNCFMAWADKVQIIHKHSESFITQARSLELVNELFAPQITRAQLTALRASLEDSKEAPVFNQPDLINFDVFAELLLEVHGRLRQQCHKYVQAAYGDWMQPSLTKEALTALCHRLEIPTKEAERLFLTWSDCVNEVTDPACLVAEAVGHLKLSALP